MKIYTARHAQTFHNVQRLLSGQIEAMLTEDGIKKAKDLAKEIYKNKDEYNIKHIYTSNLQRAKDTAFFTKEALNLNSIADDRLNEMHFGDLEGQKIDRDYFFSIVNYAYKYFPGGESLMKMAQRIYNFLDEIIEKHKNENVLIFAHGMSLRIIRTYFLNLSEQEYSIAIDNCQLLCFDSENLK